MSKYENEFRNEVLDPAGYIVIRSAGSMGEGDLVAIWPDDSTATVIECKAVNGDRCYISRRQRTKEQYKHMMRLAKQGVNAIYAVRWKGLKNLRGEPVVKKWSIFRMDRLMELNNTWPVLRFKEGLSFKEWDGGMFGR